MRVLGVLASVSCLAGAGCGQSAITIQGGADPSSLLEDFEGEPASADLGEVRFRSDVCQQFDLTPPYRPLNEQDLIAFLKQRDLQVSSTVERSDLVYLDVSCAGTAEPVRLRVAMLPSAEAAGRELHEALLEHGTGHWGVRRSNLAVLAPPGSVTEVVQYSASTKLACWGTLMVAGLDDVYVIPGGYLEL